MTCDRDLMTVATGSEPSKDTSYLSLIIFFVPVLNSHNHLCGHDSENYILLFEKDIRILELIS